jgi:hypothetical protein
MKIACLAVMMASMYSCSTGNDEEMISSERNQKNPFVPDVVSKVSLQQFVGKYSGAWWMNDVKTEADNIYYLFYEKTSQKPDVIEFNENVKPSYVQFYYNSQTTSSLIQFYEFPFKAIARQLFPDIEIAYLTIETPDGAPLDPEETLFLKIIIDAENSGDNSICQFYSMPLELVGYSGDAVYNNFHPTMGIAYLRMPFVVTTKDGNYFAMVLDFLPDKSTVSLDIASGMMSCNLVIRQIEIYDKDMQKSIRSLDQDLKLTFISTEKKSE